MIKKLQTLLYTIIFASTAFSQKSKINIQDFSDKTLLQQLKVEQAVSGIAVLMNLNTNTIISSSTYSKKGSLYFKDSSLLTTQIEPGSLVVPMSAGILLDNFEVSLCDSVDLEGGKAIINGYSVLDAERHGISYLKLLDIIAESSNVGIAKFIDKSFKKDPLKIDFANAIHKYVDNNDTSIIAVQQSKNIPFMSFGYGITLTPSQIFNFYNRVAKNDSTLFNKQQTLLSIQKSLEQVCTNGTAKNIFSKNKYSVAGKTSTSLVANGTKGYSGMQFQTAFIGYTSIKNTLYGCMVIIKCKPHAINHFGATVAAPIFKTILNKLL